MRSAFFHGKGFEGREQALPPVFKQPEAVNRGHLRAGYSPRLAGLPFTL